MTTTTTGGIPDPDAPGHWIVPPWPDGDGLVARIDHIARFWPQSAESNTRRVVFYQGLLATIDEGVAVGLPSFVDAHWLDEFRQAVAGCVDTYQARLADEAVQRPAVVRRLRMKNARSAA